MAAFDDVDRERLMADASIVRNRAKVEASIANARAFLAVVAEFGSFAGYLDTFVPEPAPRPTPDVVQGAIPSTTPLSDALSKDLKRRGFSFVGSTVVYAFLQSVGRVDDHVFGCFRYSAESS